MSPQRSDDQPASVAAEPALQAVAESLLSGDNRSIRAVLDSMGEGLIVINASGFITDVNPYTLRALGYESDDELVGQWFSGAVQAVDQHRNPLNDLSRPIVRALTTGEPVSDYTYYLRRDGSIMPIFVTVAPILIDGRPSGAIELFRDITLERQLDIAKDEFVSLASHQLRTPASGVKAILAMMLDGDLGPLTDRQKLYLGKAMRGNDRQLEIIEDILNAARIDSGQMELEIERLDLSRLAHEAIGEHRRQLDAQQLSLKLSVPPGVMAWGDAGKLRMVLDNLISNAIKYTTPGGQIAVALSARPTAAVITVEDTGVGIAADDLPRLFGKFARIDNELSTLVGGSGLGLYLANSIIELHHGTITVTSKPGVGSRFTVSLPIKRKADR